MNVNRFEQAQLQEVATLVLDLLRDPRGSAFQVNDFLLLLSVVYIYIYIYTYLKVCIALLDKIIGIEVASDNFKRRHRLYSLIGVSA